jgi:hypothetical protein
MAGWAARYYEFEIERVLTGKTFSSQTVDDGATFCCLGQNSSSIFDNAQRSVESDKGEVQSSTRHKLFYEISPILDLTSHQRHTNCLMNPVICGCKLPIKTEYKRIRNCVVFRSRGVIINNHASRVAVRRLYRAIENKKKSRLP